MLSEKSKLPLSQLSKDRKRKRGWIPEKREQIKQGHGWMDGFVAEEEDWAVGRIDGSWIMDVHPFGDCKAHTPPQRGEWATINRSRCTWFGHGVMDWFWLSGSASQLCVIGGANLCFKALMTILPSNVHRIKQTSTLASLPNFTMATHLHFVHGFSPHPDPTRQ